MSFTPYIHFSGQCEEAMTFYASVFGSDDLQFYRYSESPPEAGEISNPDRIMHASMTIGDEKLLASDFPSGGDPQQAVSISYETDTVERAKFLTDMLSADGGSMIMPFGPTFFSPGFGMFRDRFGTHWMIMARPA
jgi:PhnB protein